MLPVSPGPRTAPISLSPSRNVLWISQASIDNEMGSRAMCFARLAKSRVLEAEQAPDPDISQSGP